MEIAVISGKGGTGKSTISAAFATLNGKVILTDCDVDAANLYLLFNPSHKEEVIYKEEPRLKLTTQNVQIAGSASGTAGLMQFPVHVTRL